MIESLALLADEQHAYVTTSGRVTGQSHEIEIWFASNVTTVFLMSGGGDRSDWVRNLLHDRRTTVRIADHSGSFIARMNLSDDERRFAPNELARKYRPGSAASWRDGYLVALDPAEQS
jgi:F420H(2)-dependent quinone reductase